MTRQPNQCIDPATDNAIQPKGYPYVRPKKRKFRKTRLGGYELDIDPAMVKQLARLQLNTREIASVLGVDQKVIIEKFNEQVTLGKLAGLGDLRRAQYRKAVIDKNPAMLIWLGKQYLGQSDETRVEHTYEPDVRNLLKKFETIDLPVARKHHSIQEVRTINKQALKHEAAARAEYGKQVDQDIADAEAALNDNTPDIRPERDDETGRFLEQ